MLDYLKKTKCKSGSLFVLSHYGDVLVSAGKISKADTTVLGSLAASTLAAAEGLGELLRMKGNPIRFGDEKSSFWLEKLGGEWLLVGVKCHLNEKILKILCTNLKKFLAQSNSSRAAEALDGMTETAIDSRLNDRMKGKRV